MIRIDPQIYSGVRFVYDNDELIGSIDNSKRFVFISAIHAESYGFTAMSFGGFPNQIVKPHLIQGFQIDSSLNELEIITIVLNTSRSKNLCNNTLSRG